MLPGNIPYNFQSKNVLILVLITLVFLCSKIIKKDKVMKMVSALLLLSCICIQMYINCGVIWGNTYKDVYEILERQIENIKVAESLLPERSNRYDRFFGFGVSAWSNNTMSLVGNNDALGYINPMPRTLLFYLK
jgi:hypothetical protein